jgi:flavin reductase (DIM6/NTAB) family NADH-FMN oxidoreductase RutF
MIDPLELRRIRGRFATGVTVVTARYGAERCGLTVNAFATLSLEPPQVLVSLNTRNRSFACFSGAGGFAVNILAVGQEELSRRFASLEEDKFAGLSFRDGTTGAPLFEGCHAYLECRTVQIHRPPGTHAIFIGEVVSMESGIGEPLAFYRGKYGTVRIAGS